MPFSKIRNYKEGEGALAWQQMAAIALQKNPDILAARAAVTSGVYARNIAAGDYLPKVDGTLNRAQTDQPGEKTAQELSVGMEARQNLFSGFDTTANTIKAQKNLKAAEQAYKETSANVRFRLRSAYIELLKFQKLADVLQHIAERRRSNSELIHLRYEAGREHIGASLRADAFVEQALFEIRQTGRSMETQSLDLGRELGGDFVRDPRIMGDLEKSVPEAPAADPDYVALAEQTPRVRRLINEAESAKAAILSAQSALWPQADGTYVHEYAGNHASNLKKDTFLGLAVTVPFFNGGENIQGILKAKADYDSAREAARSARDETVILLSDAWAKFVDAVELVRVQAKFLEASRKRSEIVKAEYSSGLSNFQEFDQTEQDLANAEKNYVQSRADAMTQQANWELVKGSTLEDVVHESE